MASYPKRNARKRVAIICANQSKIRSEPSKLKVPNKWKMRVCEKQNGKKNKMIERKWQLQLTMREEIIKGKLRIVNFGVLQANPLIPYFLDS